MNGRRKTWREKMGPGSPHKVTLPKPYCGAPVGGLMLVASPELVDAYARNVPAGETRTAAELRQELAAAHGADISCPTSTGIFTRIVAEAALEALAEGAPTSSVTPFWRIVDPDSDLAGKLSCGREFVRARRAAEAAARGA